MCAAKRCDQKWCFFLVLWKYLYWNSVWNLKGRMTFGVHRPSTNFRDDAFWTKYQPTEKNTMVMPFAQWYFISCRHFLKKHDLHSLKSNLGLIAGEELEQFSGEDLRNQLTRIFSSKDQSEWAEIFDGTDACVTPVVDTQQAHSHPHNVARSSFVKDPRSSKYSPVSQDCIFG